MLKYDIGQVELYTSVHEVKAATLSSEAKKFIFCNTKSLNDKLELIEKLLENRSTVPQTPSANYFEDKKNCMLASKYEIISTTEKSICGMTPDKKLDSTPSIRKSRYRAAKPLFSHHQSMSHTPFKDLNSRTSSNMNTLSANEF